MKTLLLSAGLAVLSCTAVIAAPCLPANLQTYINLGATGCQVEAVQFNNFTLLPGQTSGTPVDPAQVQVAPAGTGLNPMLSFALNTTANAGQVFESLFRFSASGSLFAASINLASPAITGDGAAVAVLDVCPGGSFSGSAPSGCPTSPASLVAFAIAQSSLLSNSARFPVSSTADVFVDLTVDGGQAGSATVNAASIGFSNVPEPSTGLLIALGLSALAIARARRRS